MILYARARITILIGPTLGDLFPRGGPIQDPVLTGGFTTKYIQSRKDSKNVPPKYTYGERNFTLAERTRI